MTFITVLKSCLTFLTKCLCGKTKNSDRDSSGSNPLGKICDEHLSNSQTTSRLIENLSVSSDRDSSGSDPEKSDKAQNHRPLGEICDEHSSNSQATSRLSGNLSVSSDQDSSKSDKAQNYRPLAEIYNENFEFPNCCYLCEGYNGPCFDDSTCKNCHDFLLLGVYSSYTPLQLEADVVDVVPDNKTLVFDEGESNSEDSPHAESHPQLKSESPSESEEVLSPSPVLVENFLFKLLSKVDNRFKIDKDLMDSFPCRTCLSNIAKNKKIRYENDGSLKRRLESELKEMRAELPDGIKIVPIDVCCYQWCGAINGPSESPYDGGLFFIYILLPANFPFVPPKVKFLTKIFHPNVSRHGNVWVDFLHQEWSPALTLTKILLSIQSLLNDPYCEVSMNPEIGNLYKIDKASYEVVARAWTRKYAMHHVQKKFLETAL